MGTLEYLDIVDESGQPTGVIVSRDAAHTDGILHRTAHVWVVRRTEGKLQVLLQKRSVDKDSFPGLYDTSSAGHIPAGSEPLESALRELKEELGISAEPGQLRFIGNFRIHYEKVFHDRLFKDNEMTFVYIYNEPVDINKLTIQKSEIDEVRWFDVQEVMEEFQYSRKRFCVPSGGLKLMAKEMGE